MRSFVLVCLAACAGLLIDVSRAYADATPDPSRPCRAADVGKPCPPDRYHPPERCVETVCDTGTDRRHEPEIIGGEPKPLCYECRYDAEADRPNRERRERERALAIAEAEREDRLDAERRHRKKRNAVAVGGLLGLLVAAYFIAPRLRPKKS